MSISIRELMRLQALEQLVAAQGARIEAIEQRLADAGAACNGEQPEPLADHNATLQADGERLREAIRPILEADTGGRHGSAKRVLRVLLETKIGREQQPTLRCVQHHITQLRKAAALHE